MGESISRIPLFGWVPLPVMTHDADNLHNTWTKLWNSYNALKMRDPVEATPITFVESTIKQFEGLVGKMDAAIAAVVELNRMFEEQSRAFEIIHNILGHMMDTTNREDATTRKAFIEICINQTVEQIQDVSSLLPNGDILLTFVFPPQAANC